MDWILDGRGRGRSFNLANFPGSLFSILCILYLVSLFVGSHEYTAWIYCIFVYSSGILGLPLWQLRHLPIPLSISRVASVCSNSHSKSSDGLAVGELVLNNVNFSSQLQPHARSVSIQNNFQRGIITRHSWVPLMASIDIDAWPQVLESRRRRCSVPSSRVSPLAHCVYQS